MIRFTQHASVKNTNKRACPCIQGGYIVGNYVKKNLIAEEHVVYMAKLHWVRFISWRSILTLFIAPIIASATSEFAITNRRVIIKVGWVARRTIELNLSKIESVKVNQGLLGRILGYGTIIIIGTGGTTEPFSLISNPLEFRRKFQEQVP